MQLLSSTQSAFNVLELDEESIVSRIEAMQKQESNGYRCSYYLKTDRQRQEEKYDPSTQEAPETLQLKHQVNQEFRREIVEWLFSMVDYLELTNETVSIAMSLVDRFLMTESGIPSLGNRRTFQLASIGAFFIAIKLFEPAIVDAETMSVCVRGEYTTKEILTMECDLLEALEWRVNPPTPLTFIHHFLSLCPQDLIPESVVCAIYDAARFQAEAAVKDYFFVAVNSSTIAIASILNAIEGMPKTFLADNARHAFLQKLMDATSSQDSLSKSFKTKEKLKRGLQRGFNFEVLLLKYSMSSLSFEPKSLADIDISKANMPLVCRT